MRRATITLLAAGLACGDAVAPVGGRPVLLSVNGAVHPIVAPGEAAGWAGFGFGVEQGEGGVLVTTAGGSAAAEVLEWTDTGISARLPDGLVSGSTWVVTATDTLGPIPVVARPAAAFVPGNWAWSETAGLPEARGQTAAAGLHYHDAGALTARAVMFGGLRPDGTLSDSTYFGEADADGRVTGWAAAPDTIAPPARLDHAGAGADHTVARLGNAVQGVAYVIGGRDAGGSILADVHGLGVAADGSYGLWTALTPLPNPVAGAAAVVAFGSLFVIGGFGPGLAASTAVQYAVVDTTGALNGWFVGPRLPEGRAFAGVAVTGTTLVLMGGERGVVDPAGVIDTAGLAGTAYAIRLSPRTGAFLDSIWVELPTTLLHPRSRHATVVLADALVVVGGVYAGMPGPGESEFATIAADGTLGPFQELPAPTLATLAGGPAWSVAAVRLLTSQGMARLGILGGVTPAGLAARSWSQ